jgi:hypothetical protein
MRWSAPGVAQSGGAGRLTYALTWVGLPAHPGDRILLTVDLPDGWRWTGSPPPAEIALDDVFTGEWLLEPAR